ncbi:hypothetical protein [Streptomyces bathyalis]|uniref:RraA family protein n=1 Tax=Streptomyces bathyalis TaxID=2710756 RepID=UPI001FE82674|nr:hypothetical protein [Streptomyces bathyalis]
MHRRSHPLGRDTGAPTAASVPVEVGDVCITPGDYVYADCSGAVVIATHSLAEVTAEARRVDAEDEADLSQMRTEDFPWTLTSVHEFSVAVSSRRPCRGLMMRSPAC